jgi:AraC family transcriptional regulator
MHTVINPKSQQAFRESNVIMTGRSRRHFVPSFDGTLSIKGVLCGQAEWVTPEGRYHVFADSLLILNNGQNYSLTIDSTEETETFCVFFVPGVVEDAIWAASQNDATLLERTKGGAYGFREQLMSNSEALGQAWRLLTQQRRDDTAAWDEVLGNLVAAMAAHALKAFSQPRQLSAARPSTREEIIRRVHRARDEIESHLANDWTLAELGSRAAMSPFHLQRCFRQVFGESPKQYIARRRLERAIGVLRTRNDTPVTDICYAVGYSSLGSFSKAFIDRFGISPSAARKTRANRASKLARREK